MDDEKLDLRIRRTRKLLWDGLLELIAEKDFNSITVNEICERAMVHRTTFYKHYADKYDLLKSGIIDLYNEFTATALPPTTEGLRSYAFGDPPDYLVQLFSHAAENKGVYKAMLSEPGSSIFHQLIRAYITDFLLERMKRRMADGHSLQAPPEIIAHGGAGGVVSILQWWLEQGMPYPPKQIARQTAQLLAFGAYPAMGISGASADESG